MNIKDIMNNTFGLSNDLNQYIRVNIGEAKSKEEEDKFVSEDIEKIKHEIVKPSLPDKKIWEVILRIIYAEMLGHNTDFAHPFVVNSVQNPNYKVKRIGYIACVLLLDENSPFRIMMVASIQKDLQNSCLYNKIISLNCMPKMICPMNASAFTDILQKQVANPQPIVRKKAIVALIKLEQVLPGSVEKFDEVVEKCLRDSDPGVMIAVLPFYLNEVEKNPSKYKHLLDVFMKILQQILERKLSKDYEYDNHGAPWATIKILQILKLLGKNDKVVSEKLYPVLELLLKGFYVLLTDVDVSIVYQTMMTALQIIPKSELIALCVEKLDLLDKSVVLKRQDRLYLILRVIFRLIDVDKKYITNYQLLLLDCLDSPDEALRQNTIEILFKTISGANLDLIIGKINDFIISSSDAQFRKNTIEKFFSVLEQKAPSPQWFLARCLNLLTNGPEYVSMKVINGFITNLKEIVQYDESSNIVAEFVETFQTFFQNHPLNDCLVQVFAWFLGNYGELLVEIPNREQYLIETFEYLLDQEFEKEATYNFIYTALSKLKSKIADKSFENKINSLLRSKKGETFLESNIRISEYIKVSNQSIWNADTKIDCSFSFLEGFVKKNVFKGGKVYNPDFKSAVLKPRIEKPNTGLVVQYTKEQLEKNMKKIIQNPEDGFKYSGKGKWGNAGYASQNEAIPEQQQKPVEGNKYVGLSSDDIGALQVHARTQAIADKEKSAFSNNKTESFAFSSSTTNAPKLSHEIKAFGNAKAKQAKKQAQKNKIATSLFGQSEDLFASVSQPKRQFFGRASDSKASGPIKNQNSSSTSQEQFQARQKGSIDDEINFLGDEIPQKPTSTTQQSTTAQKNLSDVLFMSTPTPKAPSNQPKIVPFPISLESYEQLWDSLESNEFEDTIKSGLNFKTLQVKVSGLGFSIVEVMENEFVSSGKNAVTDSPVLLYVNYTGNGSVGVTCRGFPHLKPVLQSELK